MLSKAKAVRVTLIFVKILSLIVENLQELRILFILALCIRRALLPIFEILGLCIIPLLRHFPHLCYGCAYTRSSVLLGKIQLNMYSILVRIGILYFSNYILSF